MFLYPSVSEGLAWLGVSDEDIARFDALTFASAAERLADEAAADDRTGS